MKIPGAAYLVVVVCEHPGPPASLLGACDRGLHSSLLNLCLPTEKKGQTLVPRAGSLDIFLCFNESFFPEGKWATLGGSAIPRQPVAGRREASFPQPSSKNQFNI